MDTKKLTRAIDRLLKEHRAYYEGWRTAWIKAAANSTKEKNCHGCGRNDH